MLSTFPCPLLERGDRQRSDLGVTSRHSGRFSEQMASARGQRVWKRHPEGGLTGDGTSPFRMMRFRLASITGEGIGTADRKCNRVWMQWVAIQFFSIGQFCHDAQVHDRHTVADMANHRQVMRNEQISQIHFVLQVFKQVDHLCLNGYIQGGNGLITNDQFRLQRQSTCDADTLPLATGKFMWITVNIGMDLAGPV